MKGLYDVYKDNKLHMKSVTLRDFTEKTGYSYEAARKTLYKGYILGKQYKIVRVNNEKKMTDGFWEEWNRVREMFSNVDFKKYNGIPLTAKGK